MSSGPRGTGLRRGGMDGQAACLITSAPPGAGGAFRFGRCTLPLAPQRQPHHVGASIDTCLHF